MYRAKLTLEHVALYTDGNSHTREQLTTTAELVVTGDTPSEAMDQMRSHVDVLAGWHAEVKS